jgi:hypothetical protein
MTLRRVMGAACVLAACSSGSGDSGGAGGSGGAGSPGSVTIDFAVPASKSYCQTTDSCGSDHVITILDTSGKALALDPGWCATPCETCKALPCPGIACMQQGVAVTGDEIVWDGSYYESGTCGNGIQCVAHKYVAAGSFNAKMCATPSTLETPDGGGSSACTASGPAECVEVPFEFPKDGKVNGSLPG